MTGRRPFSDLRAGFTADRRQANTAATRDMLEAMALHELRQARARSQADLAEALGVGQPAVAKMERRTDVYVGNLRRYVEALGGRLEIVARFPDGDVRISNFADLGEEPAETAVGSSRNAG